MKLDEDDGTGNNDLPITSGTTLILTNERFNIDLDKATSTYRLRIRDIQETDGAIYQCQVKITLRYVCCEITIELKSTKLLRNSQSK